MKIHIKREVEMKRHMNVIALREWRGLDGNSTCQTHSQKNLCLSPSHMAR